jgi:type I restriction enzyme S subunit
LAREMKDSGIEWIGYIPKNWVICKVKHHYTMQTGFTPDTKKAEYYDDLDGYDWINISDMVDGKTIHSSKNKISELYVREFSPKPIPAGSLMYSFKLSVGQTSFAGKDLFSNEAIASFILAPNVNLHFFRYSSSFIIENAQTNIYNAKILNQDLIRNAIIPFPPLNEQHRIADFLDRKCAEIDRVLEKTRASIEEYKKLKQSVITQAVTKGIRGEREMKDSGIEWVGEIPIDWDVNIMFQIFKQVKNKNEGLIENNLLSLSYGKIKRKNIDTVGGLLPESFDGYNIIEKDDIVIRLTDLQNDHKSLRVGLSPERGIVTSAYVTVRNYSHNLAEYLYYYLHSYDVAKGFYGMGAGVRQGLNWDGLKNLQITIPTLSEQQEICDYLDRKCAEIDTLISKKEQLITELEAYKKSLIYEYVTGKKEV